MPVGLLKTVWNVTGGGIGYSVMCVDTGASTPLSASVASGALTAVKTFFAAIASRLPDDVSLSWPGPVDEFDVAGGLVASVVPSPALSGNAGTSSGVYSAASGAKLTWETGVISDNRRVHGFTYLVPIAGDQYDSNGTLASDFVTTVTTAAGTMRSSLATNGTPLVVWSRAHDSLTPVNGVTIKDRACILRSRRQ